MPTERNKVLSLTMQARDRFTPAVKAARIALLAFRRTATAAFAVVRRAARALGRAFKAMLGPIGLITAALGGLGLLAVIRSFHRLALEMDEVAKQARALGADVESIQELGFVAQITGTSLQLLQKSMQRVVRAVAEASQGVATYADVFDALNINIAEMETLDPVEQFTRFSEAMSKLESNTARVGIAMEIFGQRNLKILNLVNENAGEIRALREEARELGVVIDAQTLLLFEEWIDAWVRIKEAIKGVRIAIAVEFLPLFLEMAEALKEFFVTRREDIREWAQQAAAAVRFVGQAVKALIDLLRDLATSQERVRVFGEVLTAMATLALDIAKETAIAVVIIISATLRAFFRPLINTIGILGEQAAARFVARFRNEFKTIVTIPFEIANAFRDTFGDAITQFLLIKQPGLAGFFAFSPEDIDAMKSNIANAVDEAAGVAEAKIKDAEEILGQAVQDALRIIGEEVAIQGAAIGLAVEGIEAAFRQFRDTLADIDDPRVEAFIDTLTRLKAEFDLAIASGESAADAMREFGDAASQASMAAVPLSPQQREALARLQEEVDILGLRGRDRAARAAEISAEREIRAKQKSVEGIMGAELLLEKFILARRKLLAEELIRINGTFLQGIEQGFADWQEAITNNFQAGTEAINSILGAIESGFASTFDAIINGTKSATEAWKDFGRQVLSIIGQIIAKQIALFAVRAIFGGGFEKGGVTPELQAFAHGGTTRRGGTGMAGIVDRPTLALVGEGRKREAIIPLPDGRRVEAVITEPTRPQAGEVNVTFEINAVDTRGFQQLLTQEGELITNMIQRAMASQRDMRETVKRIAR
jgi:hypothetical protein